MNAPAFGAYFSLYAVDGDTRAFRTILARFIRTRKSSGAIHKGSFAGGWPFPSTMRVSNMHAPVAMAARATVVPTEGSDSSDAQLNRSLRLTTTDTWATPGCAG